MIAIACAIVATFAFFSLIVAQSAASMACERIIQAIKGTEHAERLQKRMPWTLLRAIHGLHSADQDLWWEIIDDPSLPVAVQADVRALRKWSGISFIAILIVIASLLGFMGTLKESA